MLPTTLPLRSSRATTTTSSTAARERNIRLGILVPELPDYCWEEEMLNAFPECRPYVPIIIQDEDEAF
jgi:hypothetical protein